MSISSGASRGPRAWASRSSARPSQKCKRPSRRLAIAGALRVPTRPSTPGETRSFPAKARAGSWQLAQLTLRSRDRSGSKNSRSPRRTASSEGAIIEDAAPSSSSRPRGQPPRSTRGAAASACGRARVARRVINASTQTRTATLQARAAPRRRGSTEKSADRDGILECGSGSARRFARVAYGPVEHRDTERARNSERCDDPRETTSRTADATPTGPGGFLRTQCAGHRTRGDARKARPDGPTDRFENLEAVRTGAGPRSVPWTPGSRGSSWPTARSTRGRCARPPRGWSGPRRGR